MPELEVAGRAVREGTRVRVEIRAARLATGEWLSLPVEVLNGARPGPTVWLSGAIHGDELDGSEIIRRVLAQLDPADIGGALLAVPVVNVFGFVAESRYLPDRRDLNRSFPGSAGGSLAGRLAHLFLTEIVDRCDYGLDYHCGSDDRENLPQVRGDLDDPEVLRLARAFGAPVTIHGRPPDGSLRKAAGARGATTLLYEGGEARRFTRDAIERGVEGTLRFLHALRVLRVRPSKRPRTKVSRRTRWIRAPRSGICRMEVELGAHVRRRQVVGSVSELLGGDPQPIRARSSGILIGRRVNPLVYRGEAVAHLAEVEGRSA